VRLPNLVGYACHCAAIEDPTDASLKEAFQCNLLRSTSAAQARMAAFMSEGARFCACAIGVLDCRMWFGIFPMIAGRVISATFRRSSPLAIT